MEAPPRRHPLRPQLHAGPLPAADLLPAFSPGDAHTPGSLILEWPPLASTGLPALPDTLPLPSDPLLIFSSPPPPVPSLHTFKRSQEAGSMETEVTAVSGRDLELVGCFVTTGGEDRTQHSGL